MSNTRPCLGLVVVLLAASVASAGCLGAGNEDEEWWTAFEADAWPARPSEENLTDDPPSTPGLAATLQAIVDRTRAQLENESADVREQVAFEQAQREMWRAQGWLDDGLPVQAVEPAADMRRSLWIARAEAEVVGDREAVEERVRELDPLGTRRETGELFNRSMEAMNETGLADAFSLLKPWRFRFSYVRTNYVGVDWTAEIGESNLSHVNAMTNAASMRGLNHVVRAVLENATARPGDPLYNESSAELSPLFDAVDASRDTIPRYEEGLGPSNILVRVHWGWNWSGWHQRWDRPRLAVHESVRALVYTDVAHRLYTDDIPNRTAMRSAVETISTASGPLSTVWGQHGWERYQGSEHDPNEMLVPVAIAELWPLIEELDAYLVDGDPVDWERSLDAHLERWWTAWGSPAEA